MAKATADKPAADNTKNLAQRLLAIEGEMNALQKEGNNQQQHYKFISHEQVTNELRPLFVKHGVMILPSVVGHAITPYETAKGARMNLAVTKLEYTIINTDKPEDSYKLTWVGEGSDSGDKGTNKSVTAAQKYFLMKLFNIAEDTDPDADTPEFGKALPPAKQPQPNWAAAVATQPQPAPAEPVADDMRPIEARQITQLSTLLKNKGFTEPQTRLSVLAGIIGSSAEDFDIKTLSYAQAEYAITYVTNADHALLTRVMVGSIMGE